MLYPGRRKVSRRWRHWIGLESVPDDDQVSAQREHQICCPGADMKRSQNIWRLRHLQAETNGGEGRTDYGTVSSQPLELEAVIDDERDQVLHDELPPHPRFETHGRFPTQWSL